MQKFRIILAFTLLFCIPIGPARAEQSELRVAYQFGLLFLPIVVMNKERMIEDAAREAGINGLKVTYLQMAGGSDMNGSLLSGAIDIGSGGVPPFLIIWSRTRGNADVRGVVAMCSMPINLNTRDPNLKTIADLTDHNKIAMPAARVSIQAIMLQMAAEKTFGPKEFGRLDSLGVGLAHPLAMSTLLSGRGEVDLHFASPPYNYQELENPQIHSILNSYDLLGNATFEVLWATRRFVESNPKLYKVFVMAFQRAIDLINRDPQRAAEIYLRDSKEKLTVEQVMRILKDPQVEYTTTPKHIDRYSEFLYRTGQLKVRPAGLDDLFFPRPDEAGRPAE
ncbi:ABC transporter substrate-binding protein [Methylobacterium nigriterrae]|uniref:ABC transporter substrate-binding protein n=1 Tax=Methylobacterium nigriterrae TaxID=3127512 RepID=UPI0030136629